MPWVRVCQWVRDPTTGRIIKQPFTGTEDAARVHSRVDSWSDGDLKTLCKMRTEGHSAEDIGRALKRSTGAVNSKVKRLKKNLKTKPSEPDQEPLSS